MDFMAFAEVTHVCDELNRDLVLGNSLGLNIGKAEPLQFAPGAREFLRIGRALPAYQRADIVAGDVADVQSEGAQVARIRRRYHRADAEKIGDFGGKQAARAAEGDHRIVARLSAAHGGHLADAKYLVGRGDFERAGGKLVRIEAEVARRAR